MFASEIVDEIHKKKIEAGFIGVAMDIFEEALAEISKSITEESTNKLSEELQKKFTKKSCKLPLQGISKEITQRFIKKYADEIPKMR